MLPINEQVYRYLYPSMKILEYKPDVKYDTNNIFQRQVLLVGAQRSGKTASVRSIALKAVNTYGQQNVNAIFCRDFEMLLKHGIEDKYVNILFFDDATLQDVPKNTLRDYFRIRHIVKKITRKSNGLIITVVGTHRYHSMPKELRSTCNLALWKSPPTNPYDRSIAMKFVGDRGINILESIELEKDNDPSLIGICVAYFLGTVGLFITPEPKDNVLRELLY